MSQRSEIKEKRKCFEYIENMIKSKGLDGIDRDVILYTIPKTFDVGTVAINKQLNLMIRLGILKEDEGVLTWKDTTE